MSQGRGRAGGLARFRRHGDVAPAELVSFVVVPKVPGARLVGAWCFRSGPLALGQNQRCWRVPERAGPHAPAGVVVAHRQHRRGDGQVQPHRPRIAGCGSGDDSGATVGITGMAALVQDSFCPVERGPPPDANHCLPLRPPQHSFAGPLEGQHPSRQCDGQRRAAATDGQPWQCPAREGVEAARAPRIGGVVSASDARTWPWRQPDSRNRPSAERTDRPLAGPACGPTPPTARSRSWSADLGVLRAAQAGRRYRP
jgi:hypothetical protein